MSLRIVATATALLALSTVGCSTSRNASQGATSVDRAALERTSSPLLEVVNPHFDVAPDHGGGYLFIFSASASGTSDSEPMRLLRSFTSVSVAVYDAEGRFVDSVATTEITTSGVQNPDGGASLTATARINWIPSSTLVPGARAVMRATTADGVAVRVTEMPPAPVAATERRDRLVLSLEVEPRGTTMVELALTVERTRPADSEEYLPSGERFRIEIFSPNGDRVWSSSHGQFFTQALGPVVPTEVGERVTYRAMFDGRSDETHERLEPGRYDVVATVPAQPRPYVLREELTWGR